MMFITSCFGISSSFGWMVSISKALAIAGAFVLLVDTGFELLHSAAVDLTEVSLGYAANG